MNVDFLTAIKLFFANYANFRGRSTRAEYWFAVLFLGIVGLALSILHLNLLYGIFQLAVLIPTLAISFRRFHDTGRSGWWVIFFYIASLVGAGLIYGPMIPDIIMNASDPDAMGQALVNYAQTHLVTILIGLLIALVAFVWQLIILILPSAPDNKYGPNPYGNYNA